MGGLLTKTQFILASTSPQRRRLLRDLKLPFRVHSSGVPENADGLAPRRLVLELALRKAAAVASKHRGALVLGADTVVVSRGVILGKPKSRADSLRILGLLNGRWHRVYTGVALIDARSGKSWREVAVSRVKARRLSPRELSSLAGKHMDKAGAYAVQDRKDPFIERIDGALDNVIGLPLANVRSLLKKAARRRPSRPLSG